MFMNNLNKREETGNAIGRITDAKSLERVRKN